MNDWGQGSGLRYSIGPFVQPAQGGNVTSWFRVPCVLRSTGTYKKWEVIVRQPWSLWSESMFVFMSAYTFQPIFLQWIVYFWSHKTLSLGSQAFTRTQLQYIYFYNPPLLLLQCAIFKRKIQKLVFHSRVKWAVWGEWTYSRVEVPVLLGLIRFWFWLLIALGSGSQQFPILVTSGIAPYRPCTLPSKPGSQGS